MHDGNARWLPYFVDGLDALAHQPPDRAAPARGDALELDRERLRLEGGIDHRNPQHLPIRTQPRDHIKRIGGTARPHLGVSKAHRIFGLRLRRVTVDGQRHRTGTEMLAIELEDFAR